MQGEWETIDIVGFKACVSPTGCNPRSHGGVCELQARRTPDGWEGRRVNTTGFGREEYGEPFPLKPETLKQWRNPWTT